MQSGRSTTSARGRVRSALAAAVLGSLVGWTAFAQTQLPLVQSTDLRYVGAFRLPSGQFGGSSFDYGATALAYNPANDSLFMVGHDWQQMVAEIRVPSIRNSTSLADLATATVLQPFSDATEGTMSTVDDGVIKVGGLMVHQGMLVGSVYSYYDADVTQLRSHFTSSTNLSVLGDVRGMYQVGLLGAGLVSGFMTPVPAEWQPALGGPALTGQCCIPIIGRTSVGPAAFVFDPANLGTQDPVPAAPLVYYPLSNPLAPVETQNGLYNGTTEIRGLVFPGGTRTVLFFGRHGLGPYCYGGGAECGDPVYSAKGTHAYPYVFQVWAYDVLDLVAVRNGQGSPWNVRPYATWTLDLPPYGTAEKRIGGAAYDPRTGRVFLSAQYPDAAGLPVIHVLQLVTGIAQAPSAPTNLTVR